MLQSQPRLCGPCENYIHFHNFIIFDSLPLFNKAAITMKVINGVYPGVTTSELDTLAAETAASMTTHHPDYAVLAARIAVSNLHKETKKCFTGK